MTGAAIIAILIGMGASWALRELLIRRLRDHHPDNFAELGAPSGRHLSSIVPRYQDMQIRFWRFVWSGRALRSADPIVARLALALVVANLILGAGVVALLWLVAATT
jgi:hypothetical protein